MAIIGFIACVIVMLAVTAFGYLVLLNCAGEWNLGGAANSKLTRASAIAFFVVIGVMWNVLFDYAPFTISLK